MEKTRLDYLVLSTTLLYFQKEHYTTTARVVLVLSILLLVLVQLSALTFHLQVSLSHRWADKQTCIRNFQTKWDYM
jgi:hypothetical protein